MIAWHYTTGQKFELIKQSGTILPADIGVEPPEQPILWFSTHPRFEPSAMKPLGDDDGNFVRMTTLAEMHEMGGGLYRLGCPISQLKCGENLRKAAKMSSIWWRRLLKSAAKLKADPADWWGHVGPMSLSELTVETMDANMRWIPIGRMDGSGAQTATQPDATPRQSHLAAGQTSMVPSAQSVT